MRWGIQCKINKSLQKFIILFAEIMFTEDQNVIFI